MKQLRAVGPLLQLAWVVAFATLIPLGAGLWLDRRLGTAPLFTLIGALIGVVAGTVSTVRIGVRSIEALAPPEAEAALPALQRTRRRRRRSA